MNTENKYKLVGHTQVCLLYAFCSLLFLACNSSTPEAAKTTSSNISLVVLGTVQDGGSPHIGCKKSCCKSLFTDPDPSRQVVSLGIIDRISEQTYLLEATPDMPAQVAMLAHMADFDGKEMPDGIFITHAHIGHYTGLMFLGREAMGSRNVPVYVMPRMQSYLQNNGPWSQLIELNNIQLRPMTSLSPLVLTQAVTIVPFAVPHRDEYSETVGFRILGPNKSALFIPDINKWDIWDEDIVNEIKKVDYAFVDATFYDQSEIPNRDMSEIPHPFVVESMALFNDLSPEDKNKIYFVHLNHSNPLLDPESKQSKTVLKSGMHVARFGEKFEL